MARKNSNKNTKSDLEAELDFLLHRLGYPKPMEEFYFMPGRRFRADRAYPERLILIEVEGGIYQQGRHQRPTGYTNDCIKYSWASILGYTLLRFTAPMMQVQDNEEECIAAILLEAAWSSGD